MDALLYLRLLSVWLQRPTAAEVSILTHQKDMLLQKLEAFEATNHKLRRLLREHHGSKVRTAHISYPKYT